MGGFRVLTQPFRIYQGIDWICNENASSDDHINGVRRVREMIENNQTDVVINLGIPSRLIELLERTDNYFLQVNCEKAHQKSLKTLISSRIV